MRTRLLSLFVGLAFIFGGFFFSGTLAQTITLGSGQVEFGQGSLVVTNCDPTVFAQPIPTATGGSPAYLLQGFTFWGINVGDCNNRDFTIRLYGDSGQVNLADGISEAKVRLVDNFFYSLTSGTTIYPGDAQGYFALDIDDPNLDANSLKKVTLDSEKAGEFVSCAPTYSTVGSDSSVVFSNVGACIFTAPSSVGTSSVVVAGGGGGGGGGELLLSGVGGGGGGGGGGQVESATITVVAGAKYVILVGAGGGGGETSTTRGGDGARGGISAAFGIRAQPGQGGQGAGTSTGESGTTKCDGVGPSTGGFGGNSGSGRLGGAKSCLAGGSGGASSSAAGNTSTSLSGASGGSPLVSAITGNLLSRGGSGGAGRSGSTPVASGVSSDPGSGGNGGGGAGSGFAASGAAGTQGVVELRYTP